MNNGMLAENFGSFRGNRFRAQKMNKTKCRPLSPDFSSSSKLGSEIARRPDPTHAIPNPKTRSMRLRKTALALLCAAACLAAGPACARAEDPADAAPPGEVPDFAKLRIGALRQILDERGLECRGCAEKADYVQMARENYHLPAVERPADTKSDPEPERGSDSRPGDVDVDEMMRQMGMGNEDSGDPETDAVLRKLRAKGISVAGKNGMAGMDLEQLRNLERAMSGAGGGGVDKGGRDGGKRRRGKKRRDENEDAEEL